MQIIIINFINIIYFKFIIFSGTDPRTFLVESDSRGNPWEFLVEKRQKSGKIASSEIQSVHKIES